MVFIDVYQLLAMNYGMSIGHSRLSNLSDRQHVIKQNGKFTEALSINCSIVQGFDLGPIMYIINASDHHPICPTNILLKYADDTYLIVPSVNSHLIPKELQTLLSGLPLII